MRRTRAYPCKALPLSTDIPTYHTSSFELLLGKFIPLAYPHLKGAAEGRGKEQGRLGQGILLLVSLTIVQNNPTRPS